jgi:hypothetical protein
MKFSLGQDSLLSVSVSQLKLSDNLQVKWDRCIESTSGSKGGDQCDITEIVVHCSNSKNVSKNRLILKARPLLIHLRRREPPPKNLTKPQPLLMLSHKFQKRTSRQSARDVLYRDFGFKRR